MTFFIFAIAAVILGWLLVFMPGVVLYFAFFNLFLVLLQGILQIFYSFLPPAKLKQTKNYSEKFVSFHIACSNEPPVLLKNTLRALKNVNYTNYEVIVLDNNTHDESIWKPVEKYIKELGKQFKFYHEDKLAGFKAGALNYLRNKTNPRAEYIIVIDADYAVKPNFLKEALQYFFDDSVALVQFPQAYENINNKNIGLAIEYEHFFATYMNMANYFDCVNNTGTLTVFKTEALKAVGDYNHACITEDAEIGTRIIAKGYKSVYVNKVMGKGLAPYDLESYKNQKLRWAIGNSQVMKDQFQNIFLNKEIGFKQKLGLISQLTAWLNFTFFPILIVILTSLLKISTNKINAGLVNHVFVVAAWTLSVFVVSKLIAFVSIFRNKYSLKVIFKAYLIHLGMNMIYSTAFFRALIEGKPKFYKTNKFILPTMSRILKHTWSELLICFGSLIMSLYFLIQKELFLSIMLAMVSVFSILILYVLFETIETKRISKFFLTKIEQSFID